jgi:uncharacterized peroxidase-related enzyme
MNRVPLIDPTTTDGERRVLLDQIGRSMGGVPNMMKALAHSPAALRAMAGFFAAMRTGVLPTVLQEKIALAVSNRNGCTYCLAVHTALGRKAGATRDELAAAQRGESVDPATHAALQFVAGLVDRRGHIGDDDVHSLRNHGFDDEAIVELLAHVALSQFTNAVNIALAVPLDFPAVPIQGP